MPSLAQVSTALQHVLTTVAEEAAHEAGCVQRARCFTGATWVQTLVFGCLAQPEPSLTDLAQTAAALGVVVSPQAIAQRFTPATAACLRQVLAAALGEVISAAPVALPLLERFTGVYLLDTSTLALPAALAEEWPGCGNGSHHPAAALKLGVRLDLRHGTLTGPVLDSARTHDRRCAITAEPLPAGALRIADLGFWSVTDLADLTAAGCWWLSRLQAQTAVLDGSGQRFDLDQELATTTADEREYPVRLGVTAQVRARLLAQRVPAAVAAARRRRLRADAKRRGHTPRHARLARAAWLLLVTNVPAERLSLTEAIVLAHARWQIELLFKLWKSHGHIDEARSAAPWRLLAEIYAKLIAMVIQHWTILLGCWPIADRSLVKAAAMVRAQALPLALAIAHPRQLGQRLRTLQRCLATSGHLSRHKQPTLAQLLLACQAP